MTDHHKNASAAVAQRLFDEMSAADQAQVRAEADSKGVSPIEIVRSSLDILIGESGSAGSRAQFVKKPVV